jgi:voltage-gated potassium channel
LQPGGQLLLDASQATGQLGRYSQRMKKWNHRKRLITRRGLVYSLVLCLLILGLGGVGFWLLEPRALTLSDGLWLAFTTAATVGYGDIVPSTHASRAFSVVVVLLGLAVLSLVTASVAAMFVETEERQIERDLMREISALRAEVHHLHEDVRALKARQLAD